jgi:hypothetical protein
VKEKCVSFTERSYFDLISQEQALNVGHLLEKSGVLSIADRGKGSKCHDHIF